MEKKLFKKIVPGIVLMLIFVIFTILVKTVDVQPIGPFGSSVGFASLNSFFAEKFPFNESWYNFTQLLGYCAIGVCVLFGCVGFVQLVTRKSLLKVDGRIVSLGVYYIDVIMFYVLFNLFPINYRPVLEDGVLEASYPSSHTVLLVCVMLTAILQIGWLIKSRNLKIALDIVCLAAALVMLVGRVISGVHWFTDILGGIILSASLVSMYCGVFSVISKRDA